MLQLTTAGLTSTVSRKIYRILRLLRGNKPFMCALFFSVYTFGLFTFYSSYTLSFSVAFTLLIIFIFFLLSFRNAFSALIPKSFVLIIYLLFLLSYANAAVRHNVIDDFSSVTFTNNAELTGVVQSVPKCSEKLKTCKAHLYVTSAKIEGINHDIKNTTVLATYKDSSLKLKYFDKIKATGTISTPAVANNPSEFNYANFLQNKKILKLFYSNNNPPILLSSPKLSDVKEIKLKKDKIKFILGLFTRKMNDVKDITISKHSNYIKSPRLEILGGVVFGDDAIPTPDEIKASFKNSGLLHLLAASGLNVAIILSGFLALVHYLRISYQIKILSGIFIILLYTFMTGFPPSIVRAAVMFILILLGKLMYRESNPISLIFAAGLLILVFKPEFVVDIGFQLSFLVTFGLITCAPLASNLLKEKEKAFKKKYAKLPDFLQSVMLLFSPASIFYLFLVPIVAQIWAAPLQAYYFNSFSTYSFFANISTVPFIEITSFLGFASTAFCLIPYLDKLLIVTDPVLDFVINIVLHISDFFAALNHSLLTVSSPSILTIFLYYAFILFLFSSIKYLFKNKILNGATVLFFIFLAFSAVQYQNRSLEVIFFSVSNADNILIKTPRNDYIIIDTGRFARNGYSSAQTVTLEYFKDKNIKNIDTMIITHYDSDHSGGVVDILKNTNVKNIITPPPVCESNNTCEIYDYFKKHNTKYELPKNNKVIYDKEGVKITTFVPTPPSLQSTRKKQGQKSNRRTAKNDKSTITLLEYKGQKFLFMGDMSINAYPSIEKFLPEDIAVLKCAHHGAKGTVSDEMMQKLKPKYTVISTGKNLYGHPNPFTLAIIEKYSIPLSTRDLGAIKFEVNQKGTLSLSHFSSHLSNFTKDIPLYKP